MAEYFGSHIKKTKNWLQLQPNFLIEYVSYNEILEKPKEYAEKISAFLEIDLKVEKMVDVIDKKLYRQRSKK